MFDPIKGSIWKSRVNSGIGMLFLSSFALWAALIIVQTAWHTNPLATAFAQMLDREIMLP